MSEPYNPTGGGNDSGKWGLVESQQREDTLRRRFVDDPGAAHGNIASVEIHWYCPDSRAWLVRDPATDAWAGICARGGTAVECGHPPGWRPWSRAFDDGDAPFYRWFAGALTNACFNEVDRHVLAGRGSHTAAIFEGDRWDPSKNGGQGGQRVLAEILSRHLGPEIQINALAPGPVDGARQRGHGVSPATMWTVASRGRESSVANRPLLAYSRQPG